MQAGDNFNIIGKKIDWSNLYGKLEDGEYRLLFSDSSTSSITIEFILKDGKAEIISQQLNGIF